ncbi:MAG: ATP-dependent Clp protease proteolytic subunit [Promethearchaeota archaeon]|jgi:ATP-dependent Clp protease protease subunit
MYEKRVIPCGVFGKCEFLDLKKYVVVNKFTEESYLQFCTDCEKALNTGQDFLPVVIDSYGGYVYSLLGMVDFLSTCGAKVITICESKCMSCGAILFACGEDRYMAENCTVMVHDVASFLWGKEVELTNDAKEVTRLNRRIYSLLDQNTGQPSGYWRNLVKENKYADLYMTSRKARQHNLATQISSPHLETTVMVDTKLVI